MNENKLVMVWLHDEKSNKTKENEMKGSEYKLKNQRALSKFEILTFYCSQ